MGSFPANTRFSTVDRCGFRVKRLGLEMETDRYMEMRGPPPFGGGPWGQTLSLSTIKEDGSRITIASNRTGNRLLCSTLLYSTPAL